jgi:hypothetical protein
VTAAARVAVAVILVLAGCLAAVWAGTGPSGFAGMARVAVMAAAVAAAVLAWSALHPKGDGDE